MNSEKTKNYSTHGGAKLVVNGTFQVGKNAKLVGEGNALVNPAANQAVSTAADVAGLKADFNALLTKLKNVGLMAGDEWNVSVLAVPTPASMPTEETASNSGHATVSIEDNMITIALDCTVAELEDAAHGTPWGTHKWLGFGVRTGLAAVTGVEFEDSTGAKTTLGAGDATEATALGLSAGDFVLYIKAEDLGYKRGKKFWLSGLGMEKTAFTMKITETTGE